MATIIRPELSPSNKYYIDKHRYYELKHFCLQYSEWKKAYAALDGYRNATTTVIFSKTNTHSDPTTKLAVLKSSYSNRIVLIERIATLTDAELASYILKAVTEGLSYTNLKSRLDIPCSRDTYYDRYRRFFWLLDQERD